MRLPPSTPIPPAERRREVVFLEDDAYVEALVGYRCWWPHLDSGVCVLGSFGMDETWPRRGPLKATCHRTWDGFAKHELLNDFCRCGVHAFTTVEHLYWDFNASTHILGEVYLWGDVRHHTHGFRATHARPAVLYDPRLFTDSPHAWLAVQLAARQYDLPIVQPPGDIHILHALQLERLKQRGGFAGMQAERAAAWLA